VHQLENKVLDHVHYSPYHMPPVLNTTNNLSCTISMECLHLVVSVVTEQKQTMDDPRKLVAQKMCVHAWV